MTTDQTSQIQKLYKLVELSDDFGEVLNLKLIDQWCEIREQHGLAQTLKLIQKHVQQQTREEYRLPLSHPLATFHHATTGRITEKRNPNIETPKAEHPHESPNPLQ